VADITLQDLTREKFIELYRASSYQVDLIIAVVFGCGRRAVRAPTWAGPTDDHQLAQQLLIHPDAGIANLPWALAS